jgi:hypothetical protein
MLGRVIQLLPNPLDSQEPGPCYTAWKFRGLGWFIQFLPNLLDIQEPGLGFMSPKWNYYSAPPVLTLSTYSGLRVLRKFYTQNQVEKKKTVVLFRLTLAIYF